MKSSKIELSVLIEKLEAAPEGSRELNKEIAYWIWQEKRGKKHPKDISINTHTTSLDAKLPNENITIMVFKDSDQKFHAFNNDRFEGIGHTEPLARRIAALKA